MSNKTIIVDCDGVLLDWNRHFDEWMGQRGYYPKRGKEFEWCLNTRYDASNANELVRQFNETAWVGYMPPLRDVLDHFPRLVEAGYQFHALTSLGKDPYAGRLRRMNLENLFGDVWLEVECLPCGAPKALALYELSHRYPGAWWVEDHTNNIDDGLAAGFRGILVAHRHNEQYNGDAVRLATWREIADYILKEDNV